MTVFLNSAANLWWAWIALLSIQVAVLGVLVWAADFPLRKRGWPQVRYALWALVFVKLLLPPSFALPTSITAPFFPQPRLAAAPTAPAPEVIPQPLPMPALPLPNIQPMPANVSPAPLSAAPAPPALTLSPKALAMLAWAAGCLVLAVWLFSKLRALSRLARTTAAAAPQWLASAAVDCARRVGLKAPPRIVITNGVPSAAVFGVFRPVVLLPETWLADCSRDEIENMLLHEFAHVRRRDLAANAAQTLLHVAFWFHPFVWLAGRRAHELRELCCDAAVARVLRDRTPDYRATLLEAGRRVLAARSTFGLGLLGLFETPSRLRARLEHLAAPVWKTHRRRVIAALVAIVLMALFVIPMASVPAAPPAPPATGLASGAPFRKTFANETTVEVLGVSTHPSTPAGWWRPDGTPLADAPANSQGFRVAPQEGCKTLEFAIRARNDNSPGFGFTWKVTPSAGGSAQIASRDGRGTEVTGVGAANVPLDAASATISVGIASGQWHTWAATSKGALTDATTYAGSGVVLSEPLQSDEGIVVTSSDDVPGVVERRIVAIDKSGQIRAAASPQRTRVGKPMMISVTFANLALDDVKEFQFQTRPFEFIEFKSILLAPRPGASPVPLAAASAASAPEEHPSPAEAPLSPRATASPPASNENPFRKTLSDGTAIELLGVSRSPSSKSSWRRPDGAPLAEAPYDSGQTRYSHPQQGQAMEFALLFDAGKNRIYGISGGPEPMMTYSYFGPRKNAKEVKGLRGLYAVIHDGVDRVRLRVGTDAGPWTTVASTAFPAGSVSGGVVFSPAGVSKDEISVRVTDDLNGLIVRRVVAVDSKGVLHEGDQTPLSSGATHQTKAAFPATLRDIKQFLLQTRPYEFVEFTDIIINPASASPAGTAAPQPSIAPTAPTPVSEPIFPSPETPFRATLPDGATVRVVGVSRHTSRVSYPPEAAGDWWAPDGSPLAEPPCDPSIDNDSHPDGTKGRAFAVEVDTDTSDASLVGAIAPGQTTAKGPAFKDDAAVSGLYMMSGLIPDDAGDVTLLVGVACGPWQKHGGNPPALRSGPMTFTAPAESNGKVFITVTDQLEGNLQRTVAAVDTSGRGHTPSGMSERRSGNTHTTSATFDDVHIGDIKGFHFETRPYQFVLFKGIALDPRPSGGAGTESGTSDAVSRPDALARLEAARNARAAASPRTAEPRPSFAETATATAAAEARRTELARRAAAAPQSARTKSLGAQSITGTVLDENGQPVPSAEITAYVLAASDRPVTAETAADGTFSFKLPLPTRTSEWILVAKREDALTFHKVLLQSDGIARRHIYALEAGGIAVGQEKDPNLKPLEIHLAPADGRIAGIVSDADGAGLQDADVRVTQLAILPSDDGSPRDPNVPADAYERARVEYFPLEYIPALRNSFVTGTHADGGFLIASLPRGLTAHLSVTSTGLVPKDLKMLTLKVGTMNASITMQQTGRIAGRLEKPDTTMNSETGIELQGATTGHRAQTQVSWRSPEFSFDELPPGEYSLNVDGWRDFVPVPVKNILVEPGKTAEVTVRLVKGSHVVGRIVDSQTGDGVPSMSFRFGSKDGQSVARFYASDAYGRFDIILAPGAYWLSADPALARRTAQSQGKPALKPYLKPEKPLSVIVTQGKYSRLGTIKLIPEGAAPAKPAEPAAAESATAPQPQQAQAAQSKPLTGSIIDSEGKPVVGALVAVGLTNWVVAVTNGSSADKTAAQVTTGEDGKFSFAAPDEPYTVVILSDKGFALAQRDDIVENAPLRLVPWGGIVGTIARSAGPPKGQVINMNLSLYGDGVRKTDTYVSFSYQSVADDNGRFAIDRVPPGVRGLSWYDPAAPAVSYSFFVLVEPGKTAGAAIGTGRPVTGKLVLSGELQGMENSTKLQVHIATDLPAPDLPVSFAAMTERERSEWYENWPASDEGKKSSLAMRSYSAFPAEDGTFRLEDVPPGNYLFTCDIAIAAKMEDGSPKFVLLSKPAAEFNFVIMPATGAPKDVPFDLGEIPITRFPAESEPDNAGESVSAAPAAETPAASSAKTGLLTVVVTDASTKEPMRGVSVRARNTDDPKRAADQGQTTGYDGAVTFMLPPGNYMVFQAFKSGYYSPEPQSAAVESDKEARVDVALRPQAMLAGIAVDADGKPVEGALVYAPPAAASDIGRTGPDGSFSVRSYDEDIEGVAHILIIRHDKRNLSAIVNADDASAVARVTLVPGVIASGCVTDAVGKPIPGAKVSLHITPEGSFGLPASAEINLTNDKGYYEIRAIPDGYRYGVEATLEGFGRSGKPLFLSSAAGTTVKVEDIILSPANLAITGIVVDAAGNPVSGARVDAMGPGQPDNLNSTTGADGRFAIVGLAKGRFGVVGLGKGDVRLSVIIGDIVINDAANVYAGATDVKITLPLGNPASAAPVAPAASEAPPQPASREISGTVVDENGKPEEGVRVLVAGPEYMRSQPPDLPGTLVATTDRSGHFRFEPSRKPFAVIILGKKGCAYFEAGELKDGSRITLKPYARVSGIVARQADPLPNENVVLRTRMHYGPDLRLVFFGFQTKSDAEGRFTFESVPPGEYVIHRLWTAYNENNWGLDLTSPTLPLDLAPGQTVKLALGGSGRPITGSVKIPAGFADKVDVRRVIVSALSMDKLPAEPADWNNMSDADKADWQQSERERLQRKYFASPDADGRFRIDDVPAGDYELRVVTEHIREARVGGKPLSASLRFTVPPMPGGAARDHDPLYLGELLVADSQDQPAGRTVSVSGTVLGANGKPAPGVEVTAFKQGDKPVPPAKATSGPDGTVRLDLPETLWDTWTLVARKGNSVGFAEFQFDGKESYNFGAFRLIPATGKVFGTVVDSDGNPLPGVEVFVKYVFQASPAAPRSVYLAGCPELRALYSARTRASGKFEIASLPASCRGTLSFVKAGFGTVAPSDLDPLDNARERNVTLFPEAKIRGRLVSSDTSFVRGGVRLTLESASVTDNPVNLTAFAAADGTFAFDALPPADVSIEARVYEDSQGWVQVFPVRLVLEPGHTDDVTVEVAKGSFVRGRIIDKATGQGIPKSGIFAMRDDGWGTGMDANDDGRYVLRLPPGRYSLTAQRPRPSGMSFDTTKPDAGPVTVETGRDIDVPDIAIEVEKAPTPEDLAKEEEDLKAFHKIYDLKDGENFKLITAPFVPGRLVFYRRKDPGQAESIPSGPDSYLFKWGNGELSSWGMSFGDAALNRLLSLPLGINRQDILADAELLDRSTPADVVWREGVPAGQLVKDMEKAFAAAFVVQLKLRFEDVERPVYVAGGAYRYTPPSDVDYSDSHGAVEIYGTLRRHEGDGQGGGTGAFETFLKRVGEYTGYPIIAEAASGPSGEVDWLDAPRWRAPDGSRPPVLPDDEVALVIQHVAEQTGLAFTKETRKIRMLVVTAEEATQ